MTEEKNPTPDDTMPVDSDMDETDLDDDLEEDDAIDGDGEGI